MKYEIMGGNLPVVECTLSQGETMITEKGAMCWMSQNMKMETTTSGGLGKALGRKLSGEAFFQNRYSCMGGEGMIAFASSFPGSIRAINVSPGSGFIAQKSAFLAAEESVQLSVFFQKRASAGFFGGEGFIMQKLSGNGTAFVEIDGAAIEYELAAGETMVIDTGYLAGKSESCSIEIVGVPGVKNALFGGEGLFNTLVKGPGKIILQTMPVSQVASVLAPFMVSR